MAALVTSTTADAPDAARSSRVPAGVQTSVIGGVSTSTRPALEGGRRDADLDQAQGPVVGRVAGGGGQPGGLAEGHGALRGSGLAGTGPVEGEPAGRSRARGPRRAGTTRAVGRPGRAHRRADEGVDDAALALARAADDEHGHGAHPQLEPDVVELGHEVVAAGPSARRRTRPTTSAAPPRAGDQVDEAAGGAG